MARMIGKKQVKDWCGYGCCITTKSKTTIVREELKRVFKDAEDEMSHPVTGYCDDPYDCEECGHAAGTPDR